MNRRNILALAVALISLVVLAVSCGHISPSGDVRQEIAEDMDEYQECNDQLMSALDTAAGLAEFEDSCWSSGCLGEACLSARLSCAAKDLASADEAEKRMQAIRDKWEHAAGLNADEEAYIQNVISTCQNLMMAKSIGVYAQTQDGCGGCLGCFGC